MTNIEFPYTLKLSDNSVLKISYRIKNYDIDETTRNINLFNELEELCFSGPVSEKCIINTINNDNKEYTKLNLPINSIPFFKKD